MMWVLVVLFVYLSGVFAADCTSTGLSDPYIDSTSGACYVANCSYIGTAPRLIFSNACTGCVSDGGNWLAPDQQGTPFSWDNDVTCRRAICNATTMPNIAVILVDPSLCQNQVWCDSSATGDGNKHPAGTSWPVATPDGCFQYACTNAGVVQPSAVSTHCCLSSAVTGSSQYYSPGTWIPTHSNGSACIKQQCVFHGANVGSSLQDTVVDQSLCGTSAPTIQCNATVNGTIVYYNDGEVFGDFVQVRKISGDGFECKRKKCVGGVIIVWPTLNDPGCPVVARQTPTTTATVVVTGPGDSTPGTAANNLVNTVTGDPNDPGRVSVVSATPISSPTAPLRCPWSDGTSKPANFQYRIQSTDADHHCVDRKCQGGIWLGVPSPSGVSCSTTPDTTPFPNNPLSRGFALQGTTNNFVISLGLKAQEDVDRLITLWTDPNSVLTTGTFTAQSVTLTNGTTTYTCSSGQSQADAAGCQTQTNVATALAPSLSMIGLLLGLLMFKL